MTDATAAKVVAHVTPADLEGVMFSMAMHLNMGRAGYGYGWRCDRYPRLMFIDRWFKATPKEPDARAVRTWHVDGIECLSMGDALAALAGWPALTDDERRILAAVPVDFVPLRALEDELAGVPHPKGAIEMDTPHSRVLTWLDALQNKGLVEYGRDPGRGDGLPWSDGVPEHLRWMPTIRRRPEAVHYLAGPTGA